jgi:predicted TIM-barrel fold metal-dependent hydrolase
MKIVNAHIHMGNSRFVEVDYTEELLIESQDKWGVDVCVVLPIPKYPEGPKANHDRIHRLCQDKPGRFFGIMGMDPSHPDDVYWKEAERCFKELGFVGQKMHTYFDPVNPQTRFADKLFEIAKHFNKALIVHTGMIVPFGLPSLMIPRAKQYPDVRIVLAHMGYNEYTAEAIIAAQCCDNIFLETSWTGPGRVKEAINKLGSDRVMMGADPLINVPWELTKIRTIGLNDRQLEDVFCRTAANVFGLPIL